MCFLIGMNWIFKYYLGGIQTSKDYELINFKHISEFVNSVHYLKILWY
jgi:hypothetical protein